MVSFLCPPNPRFPGGGGRSQATLRKAGGVSEEAAECKKAGLTGDNSSKPWTTIFPEQKGNSCIRKVAIRNSKVNIMHRNSVSQQYI
ncbi:mitochondrial import inner membrane translocase subunit Tim9 isoform X3 [Manis pentadactyla]|uniref:mitochondrial import inner membrane translocase subunit Tim9 isoform X3 n=1 Tax=Manis pentadactyla TaxID=143292 RepID=UPI00255CCA4E|nr:mitochondrial import inner membrane translocase subunit Tim9 isoform X3 [Manis pentadactyla]